MRGAKGRPSRFVRTFTSNPIELEELNWSLFRRYQLLQKEEVLFENYMARRRQTYRHGFRHRRQYRQRGYPAGPGRRFESGHVQACYALPLPQGATEGAE